MHNKTVRNKMRRPVLAALLAAFAVLLCGCTAQSIPLGRRAVVRLVYLEQAAGGYRAVTVVCDFSGGQESESSAALVQSAVAPTVPQALQDAAAAQGGQPFFAQNKLLLLSPQLASQQWAQLAELFAADCGSYRDPSVWLWEAGADALTALEDPMAFVQTAETLAAEDPHGCVRHVLELDTQAGAVLFPLLGMHTGQEGGKPSAAVQGLGVADDAGLRIYRAQDTLLGYGLLAGSLTNAWLQVEPGGAPVAVQLEDISRSMAAQDGRLAITVQATAAPAQPLACSEQAFTAAVEQSLTAACANAWGQLADYGSRPVLALDWWARQLGAQSTALVQPLFAAEVRQAAD